MFNQNKSSHISFQEWVLQDKENKILLTLSVIVTAVSFTWLKLLYPYPNFMPPDSFSYLDAANDNLFINIWAIGYSKFLRLISSLSNSHLFLVIIQYLLLQASLLYFLFSIRSFFFLNKWLFRILLIITCLNPLLPNIANFVSSDCLFTSLSLIWFTQALWLLCIPTKRLIIIHIITLLLAFTVRHNAMYYPFISIAVIALSPMRIVWKWVSTISLTILLLIYIGLTQNEYHKKTGVVQYSAFGNWQIAANALYGYSKSEKDDIANVPTRFKRIHTIVNSHMDSLRHLSIRPDTRIGVYYLWDFKSPLRKYMEQRWQGDSTTLFFKKWASVGPLYGAYGRYLILKHPWPFITQYLWPNFLRYYAPPSEFMGIYNMGNKVVDPIAVTWFGWKTNKVVSNVSTSRIAIADIFTIVFPIVNLVFISGLLACAFLSAFRHFSKQHKKIIWCTFLVWFGNAFFSTISAPIELRYQLFSFLISFCFAVLMISYLVSQIRADMKAFKLKMAV